MLDRVYSRTRHDKTSGIKHDAKTSGIKLDMHAVIKNKINETCDETKVLKCFIPLISSVHQRLQFLHY